MSDPNMTVFACVCALIAFGLFIWAVGKADNSFDSRED